MSNSTLRSVSRLELAARPVVSFGGVEVGKLKMECAFTTLGKEYLYEVSWFVGETRMEVQEARSMDSGKDVEESVTMDTDIKIMEGVK